MLCHQFSFCVYHHPHVVAVSNRAVDFSALPFLEHLLTSLLATGSNFLLLKVLERKGMFSIAENYSSLPPPKKSETINYKLIAIITLVAFKPQHRHTKEKAKIKIYSHQR